MSRPKLLSREAYASQMALIPADYADAFEPRGGLWHLADFVPYLVSCDLPDAEVLDEASLHYEWANKRRISLRHRKAIEAYLAALRGQKPRPRTPEPTEYARDHIAAIHREYDDLRRRTLRLPSKNEIAALVGVSRSTIYVWIDKGWLEWPPAVR